MGAHVIREHRINTRRADRRTHQEQRQLMSAIFSDPKHNLRIGYTETHIIFRLRLPTAELRQE